MKDNQELQIKEELQLPKEFGIKNGELFFEDINLLNIAKRYDMPIRITFLSIIKQNISKMRAFFNEAMQTLDYKGNYLYCYCTKSSHFHHVVKTALEMNTGIEVSSASDITLLQSLLSEGILKFQTVVVCNGYKTKEYITKILSLIDSEYCHVLPIVDSLSELEYYILNVKKKLQIGIRINLSFFDSYENRSRFGISPKEILELYKNKVKLSTNIELTTLHFFNEKGILNNENYWDVLESAVKFYCCLKKLNPQLTSLNIGGGMPFDYTVNGKNSDEVVKSFVKQIVSHIQTICRVELIPEPDIITEFGTYTVGNSTSTIFKINEKKRISHYDWAIINGSFITHLPDTWATHRQFPVIPINNLQEQVRPFILGGLTCDSDDYYPNSSDSKFIMLPDTNKDQYIAFLCTGAYQDALGGFGSFNHCLTPSTKYFIIDTINEKDFSYSILPQEPKDQEILEILGYRYFS